MSGIRKPSLGPIVGHTTSISCRLWIRGVDPGDVDSTLSTDRRTLGVITVSGLGTSEVTVILAPGSLNEWRGKITYYYNRWIRDHEMVCKMVWINEDNNFEFIFDYYYADNNWVRIYDMDGNMVWEIDFAHGENRFDVDLPDGMYTVKTFHLDHENPIQEFIIGKP